MKYKNKCSSLLYNIFSAQVQVLFIFVSVVFSEYVFFIF